MSSSSRTLNFLGQRLLFLVNVEEIINVYKRNFSPNIINVSKRLLHLWACPVWHSSITKEQSSRIESVQRRAVYVINGLATDYTEFCINYNLLSLHERRHELSQRFFNSCVLPSTSCLNYLLPSLRDENIIAKLRNPSVYCIPTTRTERFKRCFINYAVEHFI